MRADDTIDYVAFGSEVEARLRSAVVDVLTERPWARAAWLHGSAARGEPARDIDVGVLTVHPATVEMARDLSALAPEIERRAALPDGSLDLRIVNDADPVFLGRLMKDGRLLFEIDRGERIEFEVRALSLWLDFRPVWEGISRDAHARWSRLYGTSTPPTAGTEAGTPSPLVENARGQVTWTEAGSRGAG